MANTNGRHKGSTGVVEDNLQTESLGTVKKTANRRATLAQNTKPPALVKTKKPQPEKSKASKDNGKDAGKMTPTAPLAEAGRALLYEQYQKLRRAEPAAREGNDPEGVHQMRVATRRLRAMLKVMEETVYDPTVTAKLRRQLRGLANALGEVRDTDVFLGHLAKHEAGLNEEGRAGMLPLRQTLERRRENARVRMLEELDASSTAKHLDKLEKFVTTEGAGVQLPKVEEHEVAPSLVRHFAGSTILRRYEEVLAYETAVNAQTPLEMMHRLRVTCKRLRYTLEFFMDALPPSAKELHEQLVAVQDDLGDLNDNQVASEMSHSILNKHADNLVMQMYESQRISDIVRLREDFAGKWAILSSPDYRRKLAEAVGSL
jgi:triphosphatase